MERIGRFLGSTALVSVIALVGGISAVLIGERMITPELKDQAACMAGLIEFAGEDCAAQKVDEARARFAREMAALQNDMDAQRATLESERARLERERGELVSFLVDPDIKLEQASTGLKGAFIVVASSYRDPSDPGSLVAAMCYAAKDSGGVDPRLPLARMTSARALSQTNVSAEALQGFGFDAADLMAAQRLCPWPGAS